MIHATGNVSVAGSHKRWKALSKGANCKLLIHSDTTDASTTIVDSIGTHSPSAQGDAQHDTAQKKWGATSIKFDGTGDYITIPDHADWFMDAGTFTIDFWIRFNALPSALAGLFQQYADDNNFVCLWYDKLNQYLRLTITSGASTTVALDRAWTASVDTWYHIALIRGWEGGANAWVLTVNGSRLGATLTDADVWPNLAAAFEIGRKTVTAGGPFQYYFNGWIDEFRVVKGTAMWTQSFLLPVGRYI